MVSVYPSVRDNPSLNRLVEDYPEALGKARGRDRDHDDRRRRRISRELARAVRRRTRRRPPRLTFHYYSASDPLRHPLVPTHVLFLIGITLTVAALSVATFRGETSRVSTRAASVATWRRPHRLPRRGSSGCRWRRSQTAHDRPDDTVRIPCRAGRRQERERGGLRRPAWVGALRRAAWSIPPARVRAGRSDRRSGDRPRAGADCARRRRRRNARRRRRAVRSRLPREGPELSA